MTPSRQQDRALQAVATWHQAPSAPQVFYLGGFAGTGKTTLAKHFAADLKTVFYCAFTGKAALVMRRKGCDGASTIHSLIYVTRRDRGVFTFELDAESAIREADLVVLDECSMVGPDLGRDLLSFGRKVLVLGDPAQLPPVDGAGYFTSRDPDFLLDEIHRQAAESPIVRLSMAVRQGRAPTFSADPRCSVLRREALDWRRALDAGQVLCGLNRSRHSLNGRIRRMRGLPDWVTPGDKLICLRNNHPRALLNGSMWRVREVRSREPDVEMAVDPLEGEAGNPALVRVHPAFFRGAEDELPYWQREQSDEFAFGEAITCHKSQGSQWDSVVVFDESEHFREDAQRWLYTAVTRAAERLTLVTDRAVRRASVSMMGGGL